MRRSGPQPQTAGHAPDRPYSPTLRSGNSLVSDWPPGSAQEVALKAAAEFLAPRVDARSAGVRKVAERWEAGVTLRRPATRTVQQPGPQLARVGVHACGPGTTEGSM